MKKLLTVLFAVAVLMTLSVAQEKATAKEKKGDVAAAETVHLYKNKKGTKETKPVKEKTADKKAKAKTKTSSAKKVNKIE